MSFFLQLDAGAVGNSWQPSPALINFGDVNESKRITAVVQAEERPKPNDD